MAKTPKADPAPPVCPYCNKPAVHHESSAHLYRGRDYGPVWECAPCAAYVGCHGKSKTPLGRLANADLRRAKIAAHAAFDPLWRGKMARDGCSQKEARSAGYQWLAKELNMDPAKCHIALMDEFDCQRVVAVCTKKKN